MTKFIDFSLAATVFVAYWLFVINPAYVWYLDRYYPVDIGEYAPETVAQPANGSDWVSMSVNEWLAKRNQLDVMFVLDQ
jgi:hypothetical protein